MPVGRARQGPPGSAGAGFCGAARSLACGASRCRGLAPLAARVSREAQRAGPASRAHRPAARERSQAACLDSAGGWERALSRALSRSFRYVFGRIFNHLGPARTMTLRSSSGPGRGPALQTSTARAG